MGLRTVSTTPAAPLSGRTIVVTGASDGIGRAAVRPWIEAGATVVMVGRNEAKTAAAARRLMSETGCRMVHWEIADLSRQDAVRALAARLRGSHPRIDVLANNAGALFLERAETVDGLEQTFALNHLAYFTLTLGLLPALLAATTPGAPARVINVSSRAHQNARVDFDDLQLVRGYGGWRAYCNSKLYNLWFTRALARRIEPSRLIVQAMHPGVVSTRFATNNGWMGRLQRRLMDVVSVTPEQGADTLVWLATAPEVAHRNARYWVRRREVMPSRLARDDERAERLWRESKALTGLDADAMIASALEAHAVA
jgi:NAD(P)-dependent dehydrogenase (short-subunit alcohol dehydrogenase family)